MISKVLKSGSSTNLIKYVLDGSAHDKTLTDKRNLVTLYKNIDSGYNGSRDSLFTASQFTAVQSLAKNKHKKTKAYHLIFSFSEQEFPLIKNKNEMQKQAKQAAKLVGKFLNDYLPKNTQFVLGVQRDGKGKMLHVHGVVNAVKMDGKVLDTRLLTWADRERKSKEKTNEKVVVKGLKSHIDDYMLNNFQRVTGRIYAPIAPETDNLVNSKEVQIKNRENGEKGQNKTSWKEQLKSLIYDAFSASDSIENFKKALKNDGVKVKEKRVSIGKNADGKKQYRNGFTYYFTDADGKNRRIRDFAVYRGMPRGLGKSFTPDSIEQELENVNNIKRKQLQENATNDIRNITAKLDESNQGISTKDAGKREQNSDEINERRSEKTDLASLGYDESAEPELEIRYSDNTARNINKFTELSSSRPKRTASKIQLFKPNLAVLNAINKQFLDEQRNGRKQREERKQEFRKHERQYRKINNNSYKHFASDRPKDGKNSAGFSERQHGKTDEIENPNPFDDML